MGELRRAIGALERAGASRRVACPSPQATSASMTLSLLSSRAPAFPRLACGLDTPGSPAFSGSGLETVSPTELAIELRRAVRSCVFVDRPTGEVRHDVASGRAVEGRRPPELL